MGPAQVTNTRKAATSRRKSTYRVARRMLGRYMLTQNDAENDRWKDDGICMGSYNFDSHVVQTDHDRERPGR